MSRESQHAELKAKSERLLKGSLKHVRAAALAAVLVPLASVAVTHAVATEQGSGGGGGGTVLGVPSPCDFTTSGGFVLKDSGGKVTFGAHGGCKHDDFWGHVNVVDHDTGYRIDSLEIHGYFSSGPNSRDICGTATTNAQEAQPVPFRIRLVDNGEPGVTDQFGIRVGTNYVVTTRMLNNGQRGGGNVQIHEPNPSTTGPDPAPTDVTACLVDPPEPR